MSVRQVPIELSTYLHSRLPTILGSYFSRTVEVKNYEVGVPPQTSFSSGLFQIGVDFVSSGREGHIELFLKQPRYRRDGRAAGFDGMKDKRADMVSYEASRLTHSRNLGCNTPKLVARDGDRIFMEFIEGDKLQTLLYRSVDTPEDQMLLLSGVMAQLADTHNRWKSSFTLFGDYLTVRSREYGRRFATALSKVIGGELPSSERRAILDVFDRRGLSEVINEYDEGLIHGDLHPGQVIITKKGEVYFVDLGRFSQGPVLFDLASVLTSPLANLGRSHKSLVAKQYREERELKKGDLTFRDSLHATTLLCSLIAASHTSSLVHNERTVHIFQAYKEEFPESAQLIQVFPDWYIWNALNEVDYLVKEGIGSGGVSTLRDILRKHFGDKAVNPLVGLVDIELRQNTNDHNGYMKGITLGNSGSNGLEGGGGSVAILDPKTTNRAFTTSR